MPAPDYLEPVVGWRVWTVLVHAREARLESLVYGGTWPLRHELRALCRLDEARPHCGELTPTHAAPALRCRCGIHASRTLEQAAAYLEPTSEGPPARSPRVLGRVSIWGSVVEGERGWRGERAYPARLYVPAGWNKDVAFGLAAYGVPTELLDCSDRPDEIVAALRHRRDVDSCSGRC